MHGTEEDRKVWVGGSVNFRILTLVRRTHALIIGNSQSNQEVHKETSTPRRSVWGFGYPCASLTHGTVGKCSRKQKKIVPTNQDLKIIQERSHTRFRPLLTNGCSGRRVGEAGGRSGSSRSRSPTNSLSIYLTNKYLEQIFEKKKKLLEE